MLKLEIRKSVHTPQIAIIIWIFHFTIYLSRSTHTLWTSCYILVWWWGSGHVGWGNDPDDSWWSHCPGKSVGMWMSVNDVPGKLGLSITVAISGDLVRCALWCILRGSIDDDKRLLSWYEGMCSLCASIFARPASWVFRISLGTRHCPIKWHIPILKPIRTTPTMRRINLTFSRMRRITGAHLKRSFKWQLLFTIQSSLLALFLSPTSIAFTATTSNTLRKK